MKGKKLLSAVTAIAAAAILALHPAAYITEVSAPAEHLTTSDSEWTLILPSDINAPTEGMTKIELKVSLKGGSDKYNTEKDQGYYDDGNKTKFVDFAGFIGIGAEIEGASSENWYQFDFKSLAESKPESGKVGVKGLGNSQYLLTADFGSVKVHAPNRDVSISFKDWGNKSPNYSITVEEINIYGPSGTVVVHADANGKMTFSSAPAETEVTTTLPETTTTEATTTEATTTEDTTEATTPEETSAGSETEETETEAASETGSETSAEEPETQTTTTTKAAETTTTTAETEAVTESESAAEETTAGTEEKAQTHSTSSSSGKDFGSRDSTLIIVGISAGVVIVIVVVALIVVMTKKKKK